jgi:hypothetical protein
MQVSSWSFSRSEYTPQEDGGNAPRRFNYDPVPAGIYRASIGLVRWKHWDDGGKTLKVFFNLLEDGYTDRSFVWDCSLVNKRNPSAQAKAAQLFFELCTHLGVDEVHESTVAEHMSQGGISGGVARVKLIVLEANERFPNDKNWLVAFRSPEDDYHQPQASPPTKEEMDSHVAKYDDDEIPF